MIKNVLSSLSETEDIYEKPKSFSLKLYINSLNYIQFVQIYNSGNKKGK